VRYHVVHIFEVIDTVYYQRYTYLLQKYGNFGSGEMNDQLTSDNVDHSGLLDLCHEANLIVVVAVTSQR